MWIISGRNYIAAENKKGRLTAAYRTTPDHIYRIYSPLLLLFIFWHQRLRLRFHLHQPGNGIAGELLHLDRDAYLQNYVTGFGANSYVSPHQAGEIVAALLSAGGDFIRIGSGALMLAWVAAGRVVGYYEPYMHAWDCLAGYCLVKEAGGWYHPFNTEGDRITKGAQVLAVAPGVEADLRRIAGL